MTALSSLYIVKDINKKAARVNEDIHPGCCPYCRHERIYILPPAGVHPARIYDIHMIFAKRYTLLFLYLCFILANVIFSDIREKIIPDLQAGCNRNHKKGVNTAMKEFRTAGACIPEKDYMADIKERLRQIKAMVDAGQYFTVNRARQYGKTTTLNVS